MYRSISLPLPLSLTFLFPSRRVDRNRRASCRRRHREDRPRWRGRCHRVDENIRGWWRERRGKISTARDWLTDQLIPLFRSLTHAEIAPCHFQSIDRACPGSSPIAGRHSRGTRLETGVRMARGAARKSAPRTRTRVSARRRKRIVSRARRSRADGLPTYLCSEREDCFATGLCSCTCPWCSRNVATASSPRPP